MIFTQRNLGPIQDLFTRITSTLIRTQRSYWEMWVVVFTKQCFDTEESLKMTVSDSMALKMHDLLR